MTTPPTPFRELAEKAINEPDPHANMQAHIAVWKRCSPETMLKVYEALEAVAKADDLPPNEDSLHVVGEIAADIHLRLNRYAAAVRLEKYIELRFAKARAALDLLDGKAAK